MIEQLSSAVRTARKDYDCDAWEWINNMDIDRGELSFSELRAIAIMKRREGKKIKKGEKYLVVYQKVDGDFATFRANPEMNAICQKHHIYQDY